jgi:enoyl-CoA hydratase/carnithine racemase
VTELSYENNDRVAIEVEDHVAHVTLVRADKMNALDPHMFESIIRAQFALSRSRGIRAVVLAGEGRAFCAGLDLASMATVGQGKDGSDPTPLTERTYGNANTFQEVSVGWRKLPMPVVAAVHGVCFGGGMQIASGADIRVVHPATRMAIMELKWGIIPDMGGFQLWRGTVRDDVLRRLVYTYEEFTGEQAADWGLASELSDDPLERATELARTIAERNPSAIREAKALFGRYLDLPADDILMEESIRQQRLIGTKNQMEAVASQMAKRQGEFSDG